MIIVTGAAGFIGSNMVARLNADSYLDVVAVDDFSKKEKDRNLEGKKITSKVERKDLEQWIEENHRFVECIVHLGARTDTTEFDKSIFDELNLDYSKMVWNACVKYGLPLIYASSAATYGLGEHGYNDDHTVVAKLKPLNPYGESKNEFDKWVLAQERKPFFWAGLKFFNVYGPNEYHKGRMASVIFHAFHQIGKTGSMKLFKSHRPDFKDGEQKRDFIYVKDLVDVIMFLMEKRPQSGIYNLGSGQARTFYDLAANTFIAMGRTPDISFVDTPADIRDKYQYFTEANMAKLRQVGYAKPFTSLESGIAEYVQQYLIPNHYC